MVGGWKAIDLNWSKRDSTVHKENSFHHEQVALLEQVAQIGCSVSILGGFQNRLDKALSNLVWSHSWPYFEQKAGLETSPKIPYYLSSSVILHVQQKVDFSTWTMALQHFINRCFCVVLSCITWCNSLASLQRVTRSMSAPKVREWAFDK